MKNKDLNNTILWIVIATLFLVLLVLILGMFNDFIEYKYNPVIFNVLGTFGGALAGASLAGYFSVKIYEKNIKHEEEKKKVEQDLKKIIFLTEYLKDSYDLRGYFVYVESIFRDSIKDLDFPTPQHHDMEKELRVNNLSFTFFKEQSEKLNHDTKYVYENFNNTAFDSIYDLEYRDSIKNHRYILKRIRDRSIVINQKEELSHYLEMLDYQEIMVDMKKYISIYFEFEKNLNGLKGNK